jgi:hypothetical protein
VTTVMNGTDRSDGAGVRAMAQLTPAEKHFRHAKLVRFLDENDVSNLSVAQIAEIVGISREPVRKELRTREGARRPGRKPGVPHTPAEARRPGRKPGVPHTPAEEARRRANRRATVQRATAEPLRADRIITDWLNAHPGDHTAREIEEATGIPHSTLRDALQRLGVTTAPARERNRWSTKAGVAAVALSEEPPEQAPEQDMDYVSKIADGSLVAIDKATGLLWVMKPDHPL